MVKGENVALWTEYETAVTQWMQRAVDSAEQKSAASPSPAPSTATAGPAPQNPLGNLAGLPGSGSVATGGGNA